MSSGTIVSLCLRYHQAASGAAGSPELSAEPPRPYPDEHFVRMLEPVMLVDMGNRHRNRHLARLADTLQVHGYLGLCHAFFRNRVGYCQAINTMPSEGGDQRMGTRGW